MARSFSEPHCDQIGDIKKISATRVLASITNPNTLTSLEHPSEAVLARRVHRSFDFFRSLPRTERVCLDSGLRLSGMPVCGPVTRNKAVPQLPPPRPTATTLVESRRHRRAAGPRAPTVQAFVRRRHPSCFVRVVERPIRRGSIVALVVLLCLRPAQNRPDPNAILFLAERKRKVRKRPSSLSNQLLHLSNPTQAVPSLAAVVFFARSAFLRLSLFC